MSEPVQPAQPTEPQAAQPELDWDSLRSQWEQENLTPAQVAESLKHSRKWEQRAKENKKALDEATPIVSQWRALEEASKSELERAQEELTRWQSEATNWRTKAVSSRVETLAADRFADPSDALSAIDPGSYLGAGGDIDEARIKSDLDALLERKPHWRKQTTPQPAASRVPAPNPAQGGGAQGTAATDPAQQFAALIRSQLGT